MSKVKFSKDIEGVLDNLDEKKLKGKVGIKVHFGEKGCETYMDPKVVKKVYERVVSAGHEAALVECNVLYKGSRTDEESHIKTAKEHGFDFAPIDILDGEVGDDDMELSGKGNIDEAKIGKGLEKYDSLIVLTHFKGHVASGFGGAFKNLGMGLGSRAGKLHMHSDVSPSIKKDECVRCGECIENCDVDAIKMTKEGAVITDLCIGCAMCIAICDYRAVRIPWGGSTNKELQEKIVDYSATIIDYLDQSLIYINVLDNITEDCDCMGKKQTPLITDVGFLISDDPVAIDKASLDIVDRETDEKFSEINSVDNMHKINYAAEMGLGSQNYNLHQIT